MARSVRKRPPSVGTLASFQVSKVCESNSAARGDARARCARPRAQLVEAHDHRAPPRRRIGRARATCSRTGSAAPCGGRPPGPKKVLYVATPSSGPAPPAGPASGRSTARPTSTTSPPPTERFSVRPPTRSRASSTTTDRPAAAPAPRSAPPARRPRPRRRPRAAAASSSAAAAGGQRRGGAHRSARRSSPRLVSSRVRAHGGRYRRGLTAALGQLLQAAQRLALRPRTSRCVSGLKTSFVSGSAGSSIIVTRLPSPRAGCPWSPWRSPAGGPWP